MGTPSHNLPESSRFGGPRGPFTLRNVHFQKKSPMHSLLHSTGASEGRHVPSASCPRLSLWLSKEMSGSRLLQGHNLGPFREEQSLEESQ